MARILTCLTVVVSFLAAAPTFAQDKPRYGGELVFVVAAEPPSFDGHREETFAMLHPIAPHYNTLMRTDPTDKTGTKFVGDLAESFTVSADKRVYTFKLRRGVKFHDGSVMTAQDVKASYDHIIFPGPGVASSRQAQYKVVEAVEAPSADTIVFRLKWPEGSFIAGVSSPWNWIYKAEILAKDPRWYEKNVMGTGPFKFGEYVRGSHWVSKKNPDYWDKGKPYLDGYRALFIRDNAAQVAAIRGERAMVQFRGFTPADREQLLGALGPKLAVQESVWNCSIQLAPQPAEEAVRRQARPPRAHAGPRPVERLQGALAHRDREGSVRHPGPGTPWATPPEELEKLAGYGRDINAARAEARRLLKEAGQENLTFTLTNRAVPMPYEPVGVWVIDQWRQIGVNVKQVMLESAAWFTAQKEGQHEVSTNAPCNSMPEPDLDLHWFLANSPANYSRHKDTVMDDLYTRQSRATDPEERRKLLRAFEKRLYDEEVHFIHTFAWHRIVPHLAKVRGWTITPSHFLNQQLDGVWLAE
jgi:peptide/nickel transport system substrate-binding protein